MGGPLADPNAAADAILIRDFRHDDEQERNHVLKSWLRAGVDSRFADMMGRPKWFVGHERLLREVVLPTSTIRCAVLREDPSAIAGWAAFGTPNALHFVYVKERWRMLGVARMLLEGATIARYTHRTRLCDRLPIPGEWEFDFYPALQPKEAA